MTKPEKQGTDLTVAAAALDSELRKFEELALVARKITLNSEKNLERAAKAIQEAVDCQDRVGEQVRALLTAIRAAGERQQATSEQLHARAEELQTRSTQFGELLQKYAALGEEAKEINGLVQQVGVLKDETKTPEGAAAVVARLVEIQERMGQAVDRAQALSKAAEAEELIDVARQADSLRQQISSARNKLGLLQEKLKERQ